MTESRTGTLVARVDELVTLSWHTPDLVERATILAEAQITATLALVEQQRVANVLAAHTVSGAHDQTPLDVMTVRTRANIMPEMLGDEMKKEAHGG